MLEGGRLDGGHAGGLSCERWPRGSAFRRQPSGEKSPAWSKRAWDVRRPPFRNAVLAAAGPGDAAPFDRAGVEFLEPFLGHQQLARTAKETNSRENEAGRRSLTRLIHPSQLQSA